MSRYFLNHVRELAAYAPGEQPRGDDFIKLNTNENPYPPSPRVFTALRTALNPTLRLYPEPLSDSLRTAAAATYRVERDNILVGNGSDELLSILIRCFVAKGERVAYPAPTYSLYDTLVSIQEGERVALDYGPDFTLPSELGHQRAALTFLCNPNSPSGTLVPLPAIERLARSVSGVLVVDEAYIDFADDGTSAVPLIKDLPNIVVLRSFSKSFSLAGMRVGLALAPKEIISGMIKVKDSYNVNRLSLVAAVAALQDRAWMRKNVRKIQNSRKKLAEALGTLGFTIYPSQANFVMARREHENMRDLYEELKRRKILVRYFDQPGLQDAVRITIGTPAQMKTLAAAIRSIVGGRRPAA